MSSGREPGRHCMSSTVTADLFVSADGYAKGEHSPGYFGYFGPDLDRWISEEQEEPQRSLMGRVTYELLAGLPDEARDDAYEQMTRQETTVFSRTLASTDWPGATVESRDAVDVVRELKASGDVPLRTTGSLSIVQAAGQRRPRRPAPADGLSALRRARAGPSRRSTGSTRGSSSWSTSGCSTAGSCWWSTARQGPDPVRSG